MKLKHLVGMMALVGLSGLAQAGDFVNGGFESGTTSGWTTGGGDRSGRPNASITPGDFMAGGALHSDDGERGEIIDKNYVDPNLGALIGTTVIHGDYSYRAEDTTYGGFGTVISQQVKNYTETDIYFAWKAVLQNGGHEEEESAAMILTLTDNTTGQLVLSRTYNAGDGGGGVDSRFFTEGEYFYTPYWQLEQLSIDQSLSGHDFTLALLAADCQPTAHTGYAYIDGFGSVALPVPEAETYAMMLAGLGLMGWVARRKQAAKA